MVVLSASNQDLGKGCEGGVKSIRGFWLDNTVVEACVDWIPGTWKITYQMTQIILMLTGILLITMILLMRLMMMTL